MIPYGYEIKNGSILIHEKRANTVRWIFNEYIKGISPNAIAEILAGQDVPAHLGKSAIRTILQDERYIGTENYTAIVDSSTYQAAQERKKSKLYKSVEPTGEKGTYPLSGKVICGVCGKSFNSGYGRRDNIRKWICRGDSKKGDEKCGMKIHEADILQALDRVVKSIQHRNKVLTTTPECYKSKPTRQYNLLNFTINRAIRDGGYNPKETINQIFERAQEEYKSVVADNFDELTNGILPPIMDYNGSAENALALINQTIEQVIIYKDKIAFTFKNKVLIENPTNKGGQSPFSQSENSEHIDRS